MSSHVSDFNTRNKLLYPASILYKSTEGRYRPLRVADGPIAACCRFIKNVYRVTAKLLNQGYRYHNLRKAFSKFYRRHFDLASNFNIGLKSLLQQGLSEPEFYRDLVYKFNGFSTQFRKIILRYIEIGCNIDVIRQTACMVVNPITINNFVSHFCCTPAGRASDFLTAPD